MLCIYLEILKEIYVFYSVNITQYGVYDVTMISVITDEWESCSEDGDDSDGSWIDVHHSSDEEQDVMKKALLIKTLACCTLCYFRIYCVFKWNFISSVLS